MARFRCIRCEVCFPSAFASSCWCATVMDSRSAIAALVKATQSPGHELPWIPALVQTHGASRQFIDCFAATYRLLTRKALRWPTAELLRESTSAPMLSTKELLPASLPEQRPRSFGGEAGCRALLALRHSSGTPCSLGGNTVLLAFFCKDSDLFGFQVIEQ